MLASKLTDTVASDLSDTGHVRWTVTTLIDYLNQAQLQIVLVRPDANAVTASTKLVPGTRQKLAAGRLRLLDIVRNMGTGADPGKPVRRADRSALDAYALWHAETGANAIKEFYADDRTPKDFFVFPPVGSAKDVYAELVFSEVPATIDDVGDSITLDDVYFGPLRSWMLHLAYSLDTESGFSQGESTYHAGQFYQSLGIEYKAGRMASPNRPTTQAQTAA